MTIDDNPKGGLKGVWQYAFQSTPQLGPLFPNKVVAVLHDLSKNKA
jgi:hypothetical protein